MKRVEKAFSRTFEVTNPVEFVSKKILFNKVPVAPNLIVPVREAPPPIGSNRSERFPTGTELK
jgi:hypothetical protein